MPAHFWFAERGTETYKIYPHKKDYGTDYHRGEVVDRNTYLNFKAQGGEAYVTRENTPLQKVDELLCEFMGAPKPSIERDSQYYQACHELGFWSLYHLGGSDVEPWHILWIHTKLDAVLTKSVTEVERARWHAMMDWAFGKKWLFGACG